MGVYVSLCVRAGEGFVPISPSTLHPSVFAEIAADLLDTYIGVERVRVYNTLVALYHNSPEDAAGAWLEVVRDHRLCQVDFAFHAPSTRALRERGIELPVDPEYPMGHSDDKELIARVLGALGLSEDGLPHVDAITWA